MAGEMRQRLGPTDALLLVDVQRDFCPGGALPIPGCDEVVPVLNRWSRAAARSGARVVASRDWHPPEHISFVGRDGRWPPHCVQEREGAQFHPALELPDEALLVSKGQDPDRDAYSAFDGTGLANFLRDQGVARLFVGGLAQDVCVRASVLDAMDLGFEVHLLVEGTRPVDEAAGARTLRELEGRGAVLERGEPPGVEA